MALIEDLEVGAGRISATEPTFSSPLRPVEEIAEERRATATRNRVRKGLVFLLTVAALILLVLWVPSAVASAPGGCGGG